MNAKDFLSDLEKSVYSEKEYQERHKPSVCIFVNRNGKMLYSKVKSICDIENIPYHEKVYTLVHETFTAGDFLDGKKNIRTTMQCLLDAGVSEIEIRSILLELGAKKNKDGVPYRSNASCVTYKKDIPLEHNGKKIYAFYA